MFSASFRKKKGPAGSPDSATVAMVLLGEASLPKREQLIAAAGEDGDVVVERVDDPGIALIVRGSTVMIALMPVPVPWSDLEGPCATAWLWPGAADACRSAAAHAVVFLKDDSIDVFERNLRVTEAVAVLLRAIPDAPGAYWGAGTLVQARDAFIAQAAAGNREFLPLYLWVDFRVERRGDQSRFFATTGLKVLELMEIECVSAKNPVEVIDVVFNVAHYICDHGLVLKDGDTIGKSASERIRVRHRRSSWNRPEEVLWLELE